MLSIRKIYYWIFCIALVFQIPSVHIFKYADELLIFILLIVVALDVLINKKWEKYKLLWSIIGIMIFYAIYSMTIVSYNTPVAVIYDFIAQIKPFCAFAISYVLFSDFTKKEKYILKKLCLLNAAILLVVVLVGGVDLIFAHVVYIGIISMISSIIYLYSSIDENGKISKNDLIITIIIMSVGLLSTRSKFYGEFVMALYLMFFYKPGFVKQIRIKHLLMFFCAFIVMLLVAWNKIDYYFISGGQDIELDESVLQTFARPVLYANLFVILTMHPLFGSGLASFATNASSTAVNYSGLYSELGLNMLWGVSEDYDEFLSDAFYAELAQFGVVGIFLFFYFFVWIYKRLSLYLYLDGKIKYVVGVLTLIVIGIESVAGTTILQGSGAMCMMILGILVSSFKKIPKSQLKQVKQGVYKEKGALDYLRK